MSELSADTHTLTVNGAKVFKNYPFESKSFRRVSFEFVHPTKPLEYEVWHGIYEHDRPSLTLLLC